MKRILQIEPKRIKAPTAERLMTEVNRLEKELADVRALVVALQESESKTNKAPTA